MLSRGVNNDTIISVINAKVKAGIAGPPKILMITELKGGTNKTRHPKIVPATIAAKPPCQLERFQNFENDGII